MDWSDGEWEVVIENGSLIMRWVGEELIEFYEFDIDSFREMREMMDFAIWEYDNGVGSE